MPVTPRQQGKIGLTQAEVLAASSAQVNVNSIVQSAKKNAVENAKRGVALQSGVVALVKDKKALSLGASLLGKEGNLLDAKITSEKTRSLREGVKLTQDKVNLQKAEIQRNTLQQLLDPKVNKAASQATGAKYKAEGVATKNDIFKVAATQKLETLRAKTQTEIAKKGHILQATRNSVAITKGKLEAYSATINKINSETAKIDAKIRSSQTSEKAKNKLIAQRTSLVKAKQEAVTSQASTRASLEALKLKKEAVSLEIATAGEAFTNSEHKLSLSIDYANAVVASIKGAQALEQLKQLKASGQTTSSIAEQKLENLQKMGEIANRNLDLLDKRLTQTDKDNIVKNLLLSETVTQGELKTEEAQLRAFLQKGSLETSTALNKNKVSQSEFMTQIAHTNARIAESKLGVTTERLQTNTARDKLLLTMDKQQVALGEQKKIQAQLNTLRIKSSNASDNELQTIDLQKKGLEKQLAEAKLVLAKQDAIYRQQQEEYASAKKKAEAKIATIKEKEAEATYAASFSEAGITTRTLKKKLEIGKLKVGIARAHQDLQTYTKKEAWNERGRDNFNTFQNTFTSIIPSTGEVDARTNRALFHPFDNMNKLISRYGMDSLSDTEKAGYYQAVHTLQHQGVLGDYIDHALTTGVSIPTSLLDATQKNIQAKNEEAYKVATGNMGADFADKAQLNGFVRPTDQGIRDTIRRLFEANGINADQSLENLKKEASKLPSDAQTRFSIGVGLLNTIKQQNFMDAAIKTPSEATIGVIVSNTISKYPDAYAKFNELVLARNSSEGSKVDSTYVAFQFLSGITTGTLETISSLAESSSESMVTKAKIRAALASAREVNDYPRTYAVVTDGDPQGGLLARQEVDPFRRLQTVALVAYHGLKVGAASLITPNSSFAVEEKHRTAIADSILNFMGDNPEKIFNGDSVLDTVHHILITSGVPNDAILRLFGELSPTAVPGHTPSTQATQQQSVTQPTSTPSAMTGGTSTNPAGLNLK